MTTKSIPLGELYSTSEPVPQDSHKSFYGKCELEWWTGGELLRSYGVPVAFKSKSTGKIYNLWGGWSATTGRHIRATFGINKKEYDELERGKLDGYNIITGLEWGSRC